MPRRLPDMVVVITGASSGIGRALAEHLSAAGARLTLAARRVDRLDELNAALGGRHQVVATDVAVPADCERLVTAAVDRYGRVDTVVCNAGVGLAKAVADTSAEEMARLFRTNVFGTTDVIRAAVPVIARQDVRDGWRGQVMVVSSAVARRALPFSGAYAATKAAQLSLCEAMRVELRPARIAVTSVHPAGTDTEFFTVSGGAAPAGERRQNPAAVAAAMAAAIARPRPEVWPRPLARLGTSAGTLFPGLLDRLLRNFRRPEP